MNSKNIGNNIQAQRHQCDMTKAELAECIGKSSDYIEKAEAGLEPLSTSLLVAICNALDVTPNKILAGEFIPVSTQEDRHPRKDTQIHADDAQEKKPVDDTELLEHFKYFIDRKKQKVSL